MNSKDYQMLMEAYASVYAESMVGGIGLPPPSGGYSPRYAPTRPNRPKPTSSTIPTRGGNLGNLGSAIETTADRYVKPTIERIGAEVGREKAGRMPGGNIPILGDIIKNQGANQGRRQAGDLYNTGKEQIKKGNVEGLLKTGSQALNQLFNSVDIFDIVKGHLMNEGATEQEALKIMVSMSDEERHAIIEEIQATSKVERHPDGSMTQQTVDKKTGKKGPAIKLDPPGDGTKGTRLTLPFSNNAPGAEPGLW